VGVFLNNALWIEMPDTTSLDKGTSNGAFFERQFAYALGATEELDLQDIDEAIAYHAISCFDMVLFERLKDYHVCLFVCLFVEFNAG
jgi:hypothetical protein